MATLLSLPEDILVLLLAYLHNIEDYTNLSSTCRSLRRILSSPHPNTILHLCIAQSRIFFRPSPIFLATAICRDLGDWARLTPANESLFAVACQTGPQGLLDLALKNDIGLTLPRIRHLHALRFTTINPIVDLIDKCVGARWYATPNFWDGGASDAYTIDSEPGHTFFHLAMYGELFGPDMDTILSPSSTERTLSVATRLEFIKYCIPEPYTGLIDDSTPTHRPHPPPIDPRRRTLRVGPYVRDSSSGSYLECPKQNNLALTWTIRSKKFRARLESFRQTAAVGKEFQEGFDDGWWYVPDDHSISTRSSAQNEGNDGQTESWRQRMWENIFLCQGLEGMRMVVLEGDESESASGGAEREKWLEKAKEWKQQIADLPREPEVVMVGRQATMAYPFLLGDLRCCVSGYVAGT